MIDMNKPDNASLNIEHLQEGTDRAITLGKMQRPAANTPDGYVSWNDSIKSFEKWDGSSSSWLKLNQADFSMTKSGVLNLDTLFSPGNYGVESGAVGNPLGGKGSVIVSGEGSSAGTTSQIISDKTTALLRNRSDGSWSSWITIPSKEYVDSGLSLKPDIRGDGTNALRLSYPEGGVFRGQPEDVGAIKVTFPVGFTYKMLTIKLTMYDYSLGESFEVVVSGYAYSTDGSWIECTAYTVGDPSKDRVFSIRYGNNGGKPCIYIGEINSTWSHLSVTVTDVILGFTTANYSEWSQGWDISLEEVAFENITAILPADQIGRTIGRNLILHEGMGSGFIYPTLLNGNIDAVADQRAYYTKSATGIVNVAFNITGGLAGLLFTLPIGFRPPVDILYINNVVGTYFRKSGAVEITSGTTAAANGYKSDATFMAGA